MFILWVIVSFLANLLRLSFVSTLSQTSLGFLRVYSIGPFKTLWEKEKLLVTSNFSFSHRVFYSFGELSAIFITYKIVVCKLFESGRVYNLSFGKVLKIFLVGTDNK